MVKILFLTSHVPYPPSCGDKIATLNTIKGLTRMGHQVDVLSLAHPNEKKNIQPLAEWVGQVFIVWNRFNFFSVLLGLFLPGTSGIFRRFFSKAYAKKLDEMIDRYDLVFSHHTYMAQYLGGRKKKGAIFLNDVDVFEHQVMEEKAKHEKNLFKKYFYLIESYLVKRCETNTMKAMDLNFCYGEKETAVLRQLGVDNVIYRPIGVETETLLPSKHSRENPEEMLFFGDYKWPPNQDGAEYILQQVFPKIREQIPSMKLYIAGRNAPISIRKLCDQPGVTFLGEVDDIQSWIDRCTYILSTIRIGGGIRLKVIESMAKGKAVITNTVSAEGVLDKKALLVKDDINQIADQIRAFQNHPEDLVALKEKARNYALDHHSIANSTRFLTKHIHQLQQVAT